MSRPQTQVLAVLQARMPEACRPQGQGAEACHRPRAPVALVSAWTLLPALQGEGSCVAGPNEIPGGQGSDKAVLSCSMRTLVLCKAQS